MKLVFNETYNKRNVVKRKIKQTNVKKTDYKNLEGIGQIAAATETNTNNQEREGTEYRASCS